MTIQPFTGRGSTPARRRFWSQAAQAAMGIQKIAGRNITCDEHPGKGTVIAATIGKDAKRKPSSGGRALQCGPVAGDWCTDPPVPTYINKNIGAHSFLWLAYDFACDQLTLDSIDGTRGSCRPGYTLALAGGISGTAFIGPCANPGANLQVGLSIMHGHTDFGFDNWGTFFTFPYSPILANTWMHFDLYARKSGDAWDVQGWVNGVLRAEQSGTDPDFEMPGKIFVGQFKTGAIPGTKVWIRKVRVGISRGDDSILHEDFAGDLSAYEVCGSPTIVNDPFP